MSRDINRVALLGRLGTDPVLRHTKNGLAVANFNLATESYNKAKNEALTTWHKVVVWGRDAERVNQEVKKGMPIFIEGGIRLRKYEDEEGEVHYINEVHADKVNFMHPREKKPTAEVIPMESTSAPDVSADTSLN